MQSFDHAELVAFGVSQHDPGDIALSHVDTRGPDSDEPLNFGFLVLWSEIQMDSVLLLLGLADGFEDDSRQLVGRPAGLL